MQIKLMIWIVFAIAANSVQACGDFGRNSDRRIACLRDGRIAALKYEHNKSVVVEIKKSNVLLTKRTFKIPKGRDPSIVGSEKLNRFLSPIPVVFAGKEFIFQLFPLRTNSGGANGQCGSGVELWLYVLEVDNLNIRVRKADLVQSCEWNIELDDGGSGLIDHAFTLKEDGVTIKWINYQDDIDGRFESISVENLDRSIVD